MDRQFINLLGVISMPLARVAIFIVYFWFGILKVLGTSPANPLVSDLLRETLPFLTFDQFIVGFGVFEMTIGILFLFSRFDRISSLILAFHMITTAMPLIVLPSATWQGFLIPTLEGQYIIKNILIVALVFGLGARLRPLQA